MLSNENDGQDLEVDNYRKNVSAMNPPKSALDTENGTPPILR